MLLARILQNALKILQQDGISLYFGTFFLNRHERISKSTKILSSYFEKAKQVKLHIAVEV